MPRASNGVYTLPNTVNPVVANTTITSNWANTTLADVAAVLTASLDREGRGSMQAALKLYDGLEGTPGLSFASEATSGLYRASAGALGISILGSLEVLIEAGLVTFAGDGVFAGTVTADPATVDTELATLGQVNEFKSADEEDVASATTTTVGGLGTNKLRITGTTTITGLGVVYEGPIVLRFADVLVLTHSASLLLPGGANITTAAGDRAIVSPIGTPSAGWQVVAYQRASGQAVAASPPDVSTATGVLPVANGGTGVSDGSNLYDTGDIKFSVRTTAPAGWVKGNGQTIGNASSGGTGRANADTAALFALLWDGTTNTTLPIQDSAGVASTRGANAAADFAANKRMPLPDFRGEAIRGLDDGRGVDAGRANLSSQLDAMQGHEHEVTLLAGTGALNGFGGTVGNANFTAPDPYGANALRTDGVNGTPRTAAETRMRNVAASVYIKL